MRDALRLCGFILFLTSPAGAQMPVERSPEPAGSANPTISVNGVVVNADGKPIAGATLVLRAKVGGQQVYPLALSHNRDVLARTTSDKDGRFALDKIAIPLRFAEIVENLLQNRPALEVLAWADGMGLTWLDIAQRTPAKPLNVVLTPEAKVVGTVKDKKGRGIPGVRITINGVSRRDSDPDEFEDRGRREDLNLVLSQVELATTTDAEGRFTLTHMPTECRTGVYLTGPGLKWQYAEIDTKAKAAAGKMTGRGGEDPILRSPLAIVMEEAKFVRVLIKDHAGKLVGGGGIEAVDSERHYAGSAQVDKNGEARLELRSPGRLEIHYETDPLEPRLNTQISADVPKDKDQVVVEIRLPEERWLTGQVIDADSGKGLAGVYVRYSKRVEEKSKEPWIHSLGVSGKDGDFRIPVVPGPGVIGTRYAVYGFFSESSVKFDVPPSGDPAPVKLIVSRGLAIRGRVVDGNGKPAPGARIRTEQIVERWTFEDGRTRDIKAHRTASADAEGRFELTGLSPREVLNLNVRSERGMIETTVAAAKDHPKDKTRWHDMEIKLTPGVVLSGRVVYDGKPRADATVRVYIHQKNSARFFSESKTDANGEYRIVGLEPGKSYYVEDIQDPGELRFLSGAHRGFSIEARADKSEIRLPDAEMVSSKQTLRGTVVDPKGKPVAGATVSASLAAGGHLSRPRSGPPPWTTTDKDGRFELRQLPDLNIALIAYINDGKEGIIRYPSRAKPGMNQQDIRMVLDPTLQNDPEDLDNPKKAKTPKK